MLCQGSVLNLGVKTTSPLVGDTLCPDLEKIYMHPSLKNTSIIILLLGIFTLVNMKVATHGFFFLLSVVIAAEVTPK